METSFSQLTKHVKQFHWGNQENFSDDCITSIPKVQFSFKSNFSQAFYKISNLLRIK